VKESNRLKLLRRDDTEIGHKQVGWDDAALMRASKDRFRLGSLVNMTINHSFQ